MSNNTEPGDAPELTSAAAAEGLHLDDGPAPGDTLAPLPGGSPTDPGSIEPPPVDNDHVADGAEPFDHLPPSVAQARVMFEERPGLSSVLTTEGYMDRNGKFTT